MKTHYPRHIISLIVIGLVIFSGLPLFVPEDANHDHRIDVRDAVLALQRAENAGSAADSLEKNEKTVAACEDTLKAVAGLKGIVSPDVEPDKTNSPNFYFVISTNDRCPEFREYEVVPENSVSFLSISLPSPYHPPIAS